MTSLNQAMELLREGKAIMEEMTIEQGNLRTQLNDALKERDELRVALHEAREFANSCYLRLDTNIPNLPPSAYDSFCKLARETYDWLEKKQ